MEDAKALLATGRYDGGIYLCGYAVEMALKARICAVLSWDVWPGRRNYDTFYTHNLDVLLNLSGKERQIKSELSVDWSIATKWHEGLRYSPPQTTAGELKEMIDATTALVEALL